MCDWIALIAQPELGGGGFAGGTARAAVFVAFLPVLLALPWSVIAGWHVQPRVATEVERLTREKNVQFQPPGLFQCIVFMVVKEITFFVLALLLTLQCLPKLVDDWGWKGWLVQFVSYGTSWALFVALIAAPFIPLRQVAQVAGRLAIVDAPLNLLPYLLFVALTW